MKIGLVKIMKQIWMNSRRERESKRTREWKIKRKKCYIVRVNEKSSNWKKKKLNILLNLK